MTALPALPRLPGELLAETDAAHLAVAERLEGLEPEIARLVRAVLWRRLVEATAGVGAIEFERERPRLVLPPRRRFLSREGAARFDGVEMALRHVDTRLAMAQRGLVDHVVDVETPMVLNALAESRDPTRRETNAGSIRTGPSAFLDEGADIFTPPAAEHCRGLLTEVIDVVRGRPSAHHLELAAWTTIMLFAIHPFVDGNGRTARLLFQALHSSGVAGRFDWGSMEGWATHRRRYITTIQQTLPIGERDAVDHAQPVVFAEFAAEHSIEGAHRAVRRIDDIAERIAAWRTTLGESALTYAFVTLERNVAPAELAEIGDVEQQVVIAEELCRRDLLARDPLGRYGPI